MTDVMKWDKATVEAAIAEWYFLDAIGGDNSAGVAILSGNRPPLPLLSRVRLAHNLNTEGLNLPLGSMGTIVETLDPGIAYIVEFFQPHHCVATVYDRSLSKV